MALRWLQAHEDNVKGKGYVNPGGETKVASKYVSVDEQDKGSREGKAREIRK